MIYGTRYSDSIVSPGNLEIYLAYNTRVAAEVIKRAVVYPNVGYVVLIPSNNLGKPNFGNCDTGPRYIDSDYSFDPELLNKVCALNKIAPPNFCYAELPVFQHDSLLLSYKLILWHIRIQNEVNILKKNENYDSDPIWNFSIFVDMDLSGHYAENNANKYLDRFTWDLMIAAKNLNIFGECSNTDTEYYNNIRRKGHKNCHCIAKDPYKFSHNNCLG